MNQYWSAPFSTKPVTASVALPGSKSMTNRALVLAALADAPSTIRGGLRSRDADLMVAGLTALGVGITRGENTWDVTPAPLVGGSRIDCGLAGTVVRFLPALAALATGGNTTFFGDAHLRNRPLQPLLGALVALGVDVRGETVPFEVAGRGSVPGGQVVLDASGSSQFVSGLLLAGARFVEGVDVIHDGKPIPSQPHLAMTVDMLAKHSVMVDTSEPARWRIEPRQIRAYDHTIEPDLSNAAPFLALAAVTAGTVTVAEWPTQTTQAGDALREILTQFGCSVSLDNTGLTISGPGELAGVDLDLHDVGELTPTVAALCALATGSSRLRGIAHIRGHETDRLAALATELSGLGAAVTETADGLEFQPRALHGGKFHTYADHRMVHAGVVIGAVVPEVMVEDVEATSKTFPHFAEVWSRLL